MLRYVKRFTGNEKISDYKIVLQQFIPAHFDELGNVIPSDLGTGVWKDLTPDTAEWESESDRLAFEDVQGYEY